MVNLPLNNLLVAPMFSLIPNPGNGNTTRGRRVVIGDYF